MTQTVTYNPEEFLTSLFRALGEFVKTGFHNATVGDGGPAGDSVWDVRMGYPSSDQVNQMVPMSRTIIHFEIDDIQDSHIGFGDNIFAANYTSNPDAGTDTVEPQEARQHIVSFDVGIWASDRSGGVTSRLRAYEILSFLFAGTMAQDKMSEATDGGDGRLEITVYRGGRFVTESINDVPVFRMVGGELEIRVFSRTPKGLPGPAIEQITQDPDLTIPE